MWYESFTQILPKTFPLNLWHANKNFHVKTETCSLSIKSFFTIKLKRSMNQKYEFEN